MFKVAMRQHVMHVSEMSEGDAVKIASWLDKPANAAVVEGLVKEALNSPLMAQARLRREQAERPPDPVTYSEAKDLEAILRKSLPPSQERVHTAVARERRKHEIKRLLVQAGLQQ